MLAVAAAHRALVLPIHTW